MSKRKKCPPNPLPCGCSAKGIQDLENALYDGNVLHVGFRDVHVVHCPLHAAAPKLRKTLESLLTRFIHVCPDMGGKICLEDRNRIRAARALLATTGAKS